MACPNVSRCPLFPRLTTTVDLWKKLFCLPDDRFPTCARNVVAKTGTMPLPTLMPNGRVLEG